MHPGGSVHALSKPLCTRRAARRTDRVCDRECENTQIFHRPPARTAGHGRIARAATASTRAIGERSTVESHPRPRLTATSAAPKRSLIQFLIFLRILLTRVASAPFSLQEQCEAMTFRARQRDGPVARIPLDPLTPTWDAALTDRIANGVMTLAQAPQAPRPIAATPAQLALSVLYGDGEEEVLPQTRGGLAVLKALTERDVVLVDCVFSKDPALQEQRSSGNTSVPPTEINSARLPQDSHASGAEPPQLLPGDEQNSKRLLELLLSGRCEIKRAFQEVSAPHTHTPSPAPESRCGVAAARITSVTVCLDNDVDLQP